MTLPSAHSSTTLRTVSVSSEPTATTFLQPSQLGIAGGATLRTVNVAPVSSVQYVNGAVDGNALYGNVRYLMPVQRQSESYVMVNQSPHMMVNQSPHMMVNQSPHMMVNQSPHMMVNQSPQVLTPVYLQNIRRVNVNTVEEVDGFRQLSINGKASSEISQPPSPIKSPDPQEVVHSTSNVSEKLNIDLKMEVVDVEPKDKLDTRFFGELLADVYRKNCDIHTYMSEHVTKISGRKHLDSDNKVEKEEIEQLIPKGVSELTKQQIRYLLQTRMTADNTMRMLLSTFSTLREELVHLQEDLRRLESDKEQLERDLSYKADQSQQYEKILENLRENNRQLQNSVKESSSAQRTMETQLMSSRSTDTSREFRVKDLESSKRALEHENELLRKKLESQSSSSSLSAKNQELSRHYEKMLNELREEKERELKNMRSQLVKVQTEYATERSSDKSLQLKITELLRTLEQRDTTIRRLEEEIRQFKQERHDTSSSRTVITKTFTNQYPILGLLSDDYHYTSPIKESKTVVVERTG